MDSVKKQVKEEFCTACVAGIGALVGVGAASAGSSSKGKHKKEKQILFWFGIMLTLLSILVALYVLFVRKCSTCA